MKIKLKRLMALIIDGVILYCVFALLTFIEKIINKDFFSLIIGVIEALIILFGIPRKDCIFGYESIGKKIMNLKIYQNGERVTDKKILVRRITEGFFGIPFYLFHILKDNKSLGDVALNTEVR